MPADRDRHLEMARQWLKCDPTCIGDDHTSLTELLHEVAAEARREALEEAAVACDALVVSEEHPALHHGTRERCVRAIRTMKETGR